MAWHLFFFLFFFEKRYCKEKGPNPEKQHFILSPKYTSKPGIGGDLNRKTWHKFFITSTTYNHIKFEYRRRNSSSKTSSMVRQDMEQRAAWRPLVVQARHCIRRALQKHSGNSARSKILKNKLNTNMTTFYTGIIPTFRKSP